MFSGIVETTGKIIQIKEEGSNRHFKIESDIAGQTYIDQSIAHNGVCLTVVECNEQSYEVTAIKETLDKTNLGTWKSGEMINIERSVTANSRIDGHFVQGHVDTTFECISIQILDGSWVFEFGIPEQYSKFIVEKGSICINGVSLTVASLGEGRCTVAIIPYTFEHTNFKNLKVGDMVNIEFDILGKYIVSYLDKIHKM